MASSAEKFDGFDESAKQGKAKAAAAPATASDGYKKLGGAKKGSEDGGAPKSAGNVAKPAK
jgi:hypothetical protein